jgi:hypothetical protein
VVLRITFGHDPGQKQVLETVSDHRGGELCTESLALVWVIYAVTQLRARDVDHGSENKVRVMNILVSKLPI